jgi:hypothetical protein
MEIEMDASEVLIEVLKEEDGGPLIVSKVDFPTRQLQPQLTRKSMYAL